MKTFVSASQFCRAISMSIRGKELSRLSSGKIPAPEESGIGPENLAENGA